MKAIMKLAMAGTLVSMLGACSTMTTIAERDTYAQPKWYATCKDHGTEGWFWWSKDYAYACGAGESIYAQAAEEQMYAIAMNNFAKRINSKVNSQTEIEFNNDVKNTTTKISYVVENTTIREHLNKESGHFVLGGKHYTFVRLKMSKDVFDTLINEAKTDIVAKD